MASKNPAGDRRWASGRRGGMTVLGKVAVPKPLNLPSQRHENHGLDPTVEIVPKGTLSWGSRPSSSGSNPWASVASPNGDGGPGSPGLPGRPSSGGSGTRPSTSGSDKPHDSITSALDSSSRPLSSSGVLPSNHTGSTPLQPRSADSRPSSSHLSRFAEPVHKQPMAWGPSTAAEKMGVKSMKEDGFSLSSGDFPDLGTEKDNLAKNSEFEGYSRPRSESGRAHANEVKDDVNSGSVTVWNVDDSVGDVEKHLVSGKRHGEPPHHQFSPGATLQPFDSWRGPPMNGMWYGAHPRGPAVGIPNTPGGFPVDTFSYYHHRMPPPLASLQPPPPGAGPRGPHPKGGDLFRPQVPESYGSPNMPFRPGFYPGLPGPIGFEGYYMPPMGYCNSEQDGPPFIAAGQPVYNGFGAPVVDATSAKPDQMHLGRNQRDAVPNSGRKIPIIYSRKNEWGADEETEEQESAERETLIENTSTGHKYAAHSGEGEMNKFHGDIPYAKAVAVDRSSSESEGVLSISHVMHEKGSSYPAGVKHSNLPHKIDTVNAKFPLSDGRSDRANFQGYGKTGPQYSGSTHPSTAPTAVLSRNPPKTRQIGDHQQRKPLSSESWATRSSKKVDPEPRVNTQNLGLSDEDGWNSVMNQPGSEEDSAEPQSSSDIKEQRIKLRELAKQRVMQLQKEEEERMREQKAKALAKLEELNRRTLAGGSADQNAAPNAEALPVISENAALKEEQAFSQSAVADTSFLEFGMNTILRRDVAANPSRGEDQGSRAGTPYQIEFGAIGITTHLEMKQIDNVTEKSSTIVLEAEKDGRDVAVPEHHLSGNIPGNETKMAISTTAKTSSQQIKRNNRNIKHKHKMNETSVIPAPASCSGEALLENAETKNAFSELKSHIVSNDNLDKGVCSHEEGSSFPSEESVHKVSVQLKHPHRFPRSQQGNRFADKPHTNSNIKYKRKSNETPVNLALPEATSTMDSGQSSSENVEQKNTFPDVDAHALKLDKPDQDGCAPEAGSSVPNEESDRKVPVQWKPHPHRFPRIQQGNRFADKLHTNDNVVWAPVSRTRPAVNIDSNQKSLEVSENLTVGDTTSQNTSKGKRAEMERYVPKPIAMELAQQIGNRQPSISSPRSLDGAQKERSVPANSGIMPPARSAGMHVGSDLDINEVDGRPSKLKKDIGTSRQRVDVSKTQWSKESEIVESNVQPSGHELKFHSGSVINDGIGSSGVISPASNRNQSVKAQGPGNRGKRQTNRGPRSTVSHLDSEIISGNEVHGNSVQSSIPDGNQTERVSSSRENRTAGERSSSHWQPKTQANFTNEQNHTPAYGSESNVEVNKYPRKGHHQQHRVQAEHGNANENSRTTQSLQDQHANVKKDVTGSSSGELQKSEHDKRPLSANTRAHSPTENLEWAPIPNRNGNQRGRNFYGGKGNFKQINRPFRIHDSRGEWHSAQDNWENASAQDKQRQNLQHEYQPVNRVENAQEQVASNSNQQQGHKKGQSQNRPVGNYYRRQSSSTVAEGATS